MLPYNKFEFMFPPRPNGRTSEIIETELPLYEARGWTVETKKNGTNSPLAITPDHQMIARVRTGEKHKLWSPKLENLVAFQHLKGWNYLCCELVHSKVKDIRNILYVHDILAFQGEKLIGTTFAERRKILEDLFPNRVEDVSGSHYVIDEYTWLAKNHTKNFLDVWHQLLKMDRPDDEGLVLKKADARLNHCFKAESNTGWLKKLLRAKR